MPDRQHNLKALVLAAGLFCGPGLALNQLEIQTLIEGKPTEVAIQTLRDLEGEAQRWPLAEQLDFYRLLSQLQSQAAENDRIELGWMLVFVLGAAALAAIAFARKPQGQTFSPPESDSLNTLYNHSTIFDIGKSMFRSAVGEGRALSTIVFEMDELDQVRAQQGEAIADQFLQLAALNARQVLRANDCIGRMGGEDFLIVLPNTGTSQAHEVADRIRSRLENHPLTLDECPIRATISLGIAVYQRSDDSFKGMAKRAHSALSKAQKRGVSQIAVAS